MMRKDENVISASESDGQMPSVGNNTLGSIKRCPFSMRNTAPILPVRLRNGSQSYFEGIFSGPQIQIYFLAADNFAAPFRTRRDFIFILPTVLTVHNNTSI